MNDSLKQILIKFVAPIVASVVVGLGSTIISFMMMSQKLDARVYNLEHAVNEERLLQRTSNLEVAIERHEKALERDVQRNEQLVLELNHKTEDQERRLTRLEALDGEMQRLLSEIRTDVKTLLGGSRK